MKTFLLIVIIAVVAAVIDYFWLGLIAKGFYTRVLGDLMRPAGVQFDIRIFSAALVYALMALGIVFFVLPRAAGVLPSVVMWGALLGLLLYGVYEFTNYAVIKGWPTSIILVDIIWGTILVSVLSVIAHYIQNVLYN